MRYLPNTFIRFMILAMLVVNLAIAEEPTLKKINATTAKVKIGRLWAYPFVSNLGYIGQLEYPGGGKDFYVLEAGVALTCQVRGEQHVFYGSNGGSIAAQELQYNLLNADRLKQDWMQKGDGLSTSILEATSDFGRVRRPTKLNLEMTTTVMAWNHTDYDDFLILKFVFTSTGSDTITDFYFGFLLPADVGASGVTSRELDDYCAYDSELGLAYMYDDNGDGGLSPYYVGHALISAPLVNSNSDEEPTFEQKWTTFHYFPMTRLITSKEDLLNRVKEGISADADAPGPYSILNAVGPYLIKPSGSIEVVMAIIYGDGLDGIRANTQKALELAQNGFEIDEAKKPPQVPILNPVEVSGKNIHLSWSDEASHELDFAGYRVYKSDVSVIGPWKLVTETTNPEYTDVGEIGFPLFYNITSFDTDGNESGKWSEVCRTLEEIRPVNMAETSHNRVKVVPNPYLGSATWEIEDYESKIFFTHLPEKCTIYIYSLMGDHIATLLHNLPGDGTPDNSGDEAWDMISKNKQAIVSGLYVYRVVTEDGQEFIGKFAVVKGQR
ncbi:MAG: hypothetical protein ACE5IW_11185 [bacterium]